MARDEVAFMKSLNFEFLRARRSVLADLAGAAEAYAHSDPAASLLKQRQFVEVAVAAIYEAYRLRPPYTDNLNDLMNAEPFRQSVPEVVQNKLHAVRKAGNQAVHQHRPIPSQLSMDCLGQLFEIAQWFHLQVHRGTRADLPKYTPPSPVVPADPKAQAKAQEALEKLRHMEAQFAAMLANLEAETKKRLEAEQAAETSEAELQKLKAEGQKVASVLHFNEETTRRRLIDQMLVEAGWDVGLHGVTTKEVGQEIELSTMKTASGKGYADYVLYGDDGKPLAVIEAKKTAKDAKVGAEQARLYATCLEKETGVRPVVFFTNGIDVFLWDDVQGYPYRKIYGFYSKDSLEYLLHQRASKKPPTAVAPNLDIAGRMYQLEAVKRVCERFSSNFRKALVVQATGTGKTRVAISLCDVLMRAGWAKRILFLCDRRELRKQADRAFKEFLPGEPRIVVDSSTSSQRDKRIYLATYPAMMKCYEDFDVGFFDLIIADESHRSIYKKFRALFQHFDALEVGLTATPVQFIERNTYELFACEDRDPTSNFGFKEAISSNPPYLVPFRVRTFKSEFREKGVRYAQMSAEQRAEVEDQIEDPESVDYTASQIDKHIFNKATSRYIWRSLMEEGLRDATGSRLGKTIVFARNHKHAVHLAELFSEMYPQYGSTFCRVIDNQEPKAEQLIDDFKDETNDLTIAISVDMLDTGIDVPEIVNLVFAKPVKSYVKFWQMIGRGTRLRPDLFGPGKPKTEFLVFDHWSNFWFFEEKYKEKEPSKQKSLLQHLFELRLDVAANALEAMKEPVFQAAVDLLVADVVAVRNAGSIEVRDKWKELEALSNRDRVAAFEAATLADLLSIASPLMQWRNIRGEEDAYRFDRLVTALEVELLKGGPKSPRFVDYKDRVLESVELLMKNQGPVKAKADAITEVRGKAFWKDVTVAKLEELREDLRGVMKYQRVSSTPRLNPLEIDVGDGDFEGRDHVSKLEGLELVEYQRRVESVLREHFASNATLLRITSSPEARIANRVTLGELDARRIDQAIEASGLATTPADFLVHRRLADRREDEVVLRQGAVWLFAGSPAAISHPNLGVRVFRVHGTAQKVGAQRNVQDYPWIEGNILAILEQTQALLTTLIRSSAKLHDLFFREVPEYPTPAWQEALVNALAHRDYAVEGAGVEVWLYDDRLEIKSPGALLATVKVEDLRERKRVHESRNPRIARVLTELGIMRQQGEGIPRMIEEMELSWLRPPQLDATDRDFRVTLYNEPIFQGADEHWTRVVRQLPLDVRQKRALVAFWGGAFQSGDYQELNRVDRDTAYQEIQDLEKRGLVRAEGITKARRYTVNLSTASAEPAAATPLERLIVRMREAGLITNADVREILDLPRPEAKKLLAGWVAASVLEARGERRAAHYVPGARWPPTSA